ncbi:Coenzyme F420 hydrogenase/dehydrogenase, beta subunit C-terminal domain [Campylobacter sp. JMF_08 NE1]|uniref:Coenzyme F420 hydrogenase/dehydrogenase, beta subunit C-terminal domain n=1 Tax=Campylobacter sp. JMF_08 NE1 TaxID=2983821 RepID=UPI0022E9A87C|nr:Coenzyme F420 hydrogenase/dehydrogenase, beta subunit C-terminal domain [Campylobacter sp. JMF_08 NE1]MDA3048344.1 Coenzyme F420 hydrogenase/dehydrogenase, beta subunit C-terminal domain [Campylobacter sp. JMF_08 NE1]
MNIIGEVVAKDRCIGCGACAGLCPSKVLSMDFNSSGHYEPKEIPGCNPKCDICLKVCPFYEKDLAENEISNEIFDSKNSYKEIGKYVGNYEFFIKDENERINSASGGAGYYLLSELLKRKMVGKIIAVAPCENSEKLFKFDIFDNAESLKNARKSAYYPTNMEEILKFILANDDTYAITALPCFAKALRLAMKTNPKLRKRIKYIVGLVCGQVKSKKFAQLLADLNFREHKELKKVDFRYKIKDRPSSNFAFKFLSDDDCSSIRDWSSANEYATSPVIFWTSRAFTPLACNNCNDTFALCADAVLMDAWLPKFTPDWRGHSLVITRNNELDEIFKNADKNTVHCESFDIEQIYTSQRAVVAQKAAYFYNKLNILQKQKLKLQRKIYRDDMKAIKYINDYVKFEKVLEKIKFPFLVCKYIIRKIKEKM